MRNRIMAALGAIIVAFTGALAVAAPAQAAQGCGSGSICFYDTSVSAAPFYARDSGDAWNGECFNLGNTSTSWIRNQSARTWRVYTGLDCLSTNGPIYPNSAGAMNSTFSNKIRSFTRVS